MKICYVSILWICISASTLGQNYHRIDSLKKILFTTKEDTIKGLTIWSLVDKYMGIRPDTGLYFANMGLALIKNESIKARFDISENPLLYSFEIRMYAKGAVAASFQRNDSFAIKMGFKALQMAEKSKDKMDIPRVYANISDIYSEIGEPSTAIYYLKKAMLLYTLSDTLTEDNRNYNLGILGQYYYQLGKYDSAIYYINKIYGFFHLPEHRDWSDPDFYMGKIYSKKGNYKTALPYFRNAIDIARKFNSPAGLSSSYLGISETFEKLGNIDSSLYCAKQSLRIANEKSLPNLSLDAITFLSSLHESKHLIDSAFKYQKLAIALKDSLFNKEKIKQVQNYTFNEQLRQQEIQQAQEAYQNKIKTYSLIAALAIFLFIAFILWRNNKQNQKTNALLKQQKEKVETTLTELKSAQTQLIQSEKMASLGELTAGIAHEIQNPLNFVNNFSEVSKELIEELWEEQNKEQRNFQNEEEILTDIAQNLDKINHHGKRADAIVKGMLQHSRASTGQKEPTDINALADEYLRLAYHGLRAKDNSFNAIMKTDFDKTIEKINIIPQDIGRVLLNLYTNAFYAVNEKKKRQVDNYAPTVSVITKKLHNKVEVRVKDNGSGIPQKVMDKIFQPFFTTKPTGQGTGLGLSLSYDVIKAHGGEIKVETQDGQGTEFVILLS